MRIHSCFTPNVFDSENFVPLDSPTSPFTPPPGSWQRLLNRVRPMSDSHRRGFHPFSLHVFLPHLDICCVPTPYPPKVLPGQGRSACAMFRISLVYRAGPLRGWTPECVSVIEVYENVHNLDAAILPYSHCVIRVYNRTFKII